MFGAWVASVFLWFTSCFDDEVTFRRYPSTDGKMNILTHQCACTVFWIRSWIGSEVNPFNQCCFQGDAELIQRLQNTTEGVHRRAISQQGSVLVCSSCQGTLWQQRKPLRQKPVPDSQANEQLEFSLFSNVSGWGIDSTDIVAQRVARWVFC